MGQPVKRLSASSTSEIVQIWEICISQCSTKPNDPGNIRRMADKSNGAGGPALYMPPVATPADGGGGPAAWETAALGAAPGQQTGHETYVAPSSVPDTVSYEAGGIFGAAVEGPEESARAADLHQQTAPTGLDFAPVTPAMPPPMAAPAMPDVGAPPMHGGVLGPIGEMPQESGHLLGASVIVGALGAVAGAKYGGLYGAVAGSLVGGAAIGLYRALSYYKEGTDESDKEAIVSGTYAVGAAAIAAVLWAKLASPGMFTSNPADDDDDYDDDDYYANPGDGDDRDVGLVSLQTNPIDCDIRPVGP